ncbi:Acetylcholine receptor subunit beta-like 1, partial [Caligus rogercresseyi]
QDGPHFDSKYQVKVFRDGKVLFVPSMEFKHRCFRHSMQFGVWILDHDSDMMNVNFFGGKPAVDTSTYDYDFLWDQ